MDIIVLNVDSVLQSWSQQHAYLLANVASLLAFVFDLHVRQHMWSRVS